MGTKKPTKKAAKKKKIEPRTITIGGELVFHIGESTEPDFPNDIEVGVIVGIHGGGLRLGVVKSIDPLIVTAEDSQEIMIKDRGTPYKLVGRLMAVDHEQWLPNRSDFFDRTKAAESTEAVESRTETIPAPSSTEQQEAESFMNWMKKKQDK